MRSLTLALSALLASAVPGQDPSAKTPEGHSGHGEAFNEGPRQKARFMAGCGDVHFAVKTKSPAAQRFFDQGVGQLHGFWYFEAERSFRQAAALDPECAMAYWGMAMANVDNEERATGFAEQAFERRAQATKRGRMWIEALARFYDVAKGPEKKPEKKAEKKAEKKGAKKGPKKGAKKGPKKAEKKGGAKEKKPGQRAAEPERAQKPEKAKKKRKPAEDRKRRRQLVTDIEKICYAFPDDIETRAFLVNQLWINVRHGLPISSKQANQALLDQVFAKNPLHPAHHYRIHLWDHKETAHRVADSAAKIGDSAPKIAHMWHMGGHTFDKLERFADAAWQQEASARVDHGYMMRERVMPFRIHNYAHNQEWCVRSLLAVGRVRDALALAKNLVELPRHPEKNTPDKRGGAAWYGSRRLLDVLRLAELHDDTLALAGTTYLAPGKSSHDRSQRLFGIARALIAKGRAGEARRHLSAMRALIDDAKRERAEAIDEREEEAISAGRSDKDVESEIEIAIKLHARPLKELRRRIRHLEALLDYAGAADVKEKRAILERIAKDGFDKHELAKLWLDAKDATKAVAAAREALKERKGKYAKHVFPLATLVEALHVAGKRAAAKQEFAKLRAVSGHIDDLGLAPFRRIAPVAAAAGHGADWRAEVTVPEDVRGRPPLDSLGPFRWAPQPAPAFTVAAGSGRSVSLADYRGKPVLVVFFLGFGCVHCVEQLDALKPMVGAFEKAGIEIVTIGTDTAEQVAASLGGGRELGFPVLADPHGAVFKTYRCWDDFENMALHGTFLVDAAGLVRWQDISYEPFMKTDFLLRECQRLLALPVDDEPNGNGGEPRK